MALKFFFFLLVPQNFHTDQSTVENLKRCEQEKEIKPGGQLHCSRHSTTVSQCLPKHLYFCLKKEKIEVPAEIREEFWLREEKARWPFSGLTSHCSHTSSHCNFTEMIPCTDSFFIASGRQFTSGGLKENGFLQPST